MFGSYYLQYQMYMHFIEIPRTLFLAVNKNNGEIYQVVIEVDATAIEMGLQKINLNMSHGNDMSAPPKMPCQYCDFVHFCYQNYGKDQGKTNGERSA